MPHTTINVSSVATNLARVYRRIDDAVHNTDREAGTVSLLAVSKTKPAAAIVEAYQAGQRRFGENYLQEALGKIEQLQGLSSIEWHFIGPLQANKTRQTAENFAWVHTVDRIRIARRLNDQRPAGLPPLNVCLQVNIDGEASKSGIAPSQLSQLAMEIARMKRLRLRGLMAIPTPSDDPQQQRKPFAALATLLAQLHDALPDYNGLDTLSMGMSSDMEAAIAEGATMVRIGTDIFGSRE